MSLCSTGCDKQPVSHRDSRSGGTVLLQSSKSDRAQTEPLRPPLSFTSALKVGGDLQWDTPPVLRLGKLPNIGNTHFTQLRTKCESVTNSIYVRFISCRCKYQIKARRSIFCRKMSNSVTSATYIRSLSYSLRRKLSYFLDPQDRWKDVIVSIRKPSGELMYSQQHVRWVIAVGAKRNVCFLW